MEFEVDLVDISEKRLYQGTLEPTPVYDYLPNGPQVLVKGRIQITPKESMTVLPISSLEEVMAFLFAIDRNKKFEVVRPQAAVGDQLSRLVRGINLHELRMMHLSQIHGAVGEHIDSLMPTQLPEDLSYLAEATNGLGLTHHKISCDKILSKFSEAQERRRHDVGRFSPAMRPMFQHLGIPDRVEEATTLMKSRDVQRDEERLGRAMAQQYYEYPRGIAVDVYRADGDYRVHALEADVLMIMRQYGLIFYGRIDHWTYPRVVDFKSSPASGSLSPLMRRIQTMQMNIYAQMAAGMTRFVDYDEVGVGYRSIRKIIKPYQLKKNSRNELKSKTPLYVVSVPRARKKVHYAAYEYFDRGRLREEVVSGGEYPDEEYERVHAGFSWLGKMVADRRGEVLDMIRRKVRIRIK